MDFVVHYDHVQSIRRIIAGLTLKLCSRRILVFRWRHRHSVWRWRWHRGYPFLCCTLRLYLTPYRRFGRCRRRRNNRCCCWRCTGCTENTSVTGLWTIGRLVFGRIDNVRIAAGPFLGMGHIVGKLSQIGGSIVGTPNQAQAFLDEFRLAVAIVHVNIVGVVHEFTEIDTEYVIV